METKIVQSLEEAEKVDNAMVYDIDKGVEYLNEFNRKTTRFEKEFKKLSKKQKGRDEAGQKKLVFKFVEEKLKPFWTIEVEEKFWKNGEMDYLDKETKATYIFGTFVVGHSKRLQQHMDTAFANVLKEMTDRAIAAKEGLNYQKMREKAIKQNMSNMSFEEKEKIMRAIQDNSTTGVKL